jgi:5-formyltetrahydrofolate cyclo-ligase
MQKRGGQAPAKRKMREAARAARAAAHADAAASAREALQRHGLDFLKRAPGIVSGFVPYESEIDLTGLFERLAGEGWTTCLPVVIAKGQPLEFRPWRPGGGLEEGVWGIPVPPASAGTVKPDVLLVPLLAFDAHGYRLGYGGGFYDRTLKALRREKEVCAVGVAFAAQEVDAVPHEAHDEPLDWILTENGARKVARDRAGRPGSALCG